jgi:putative Holliday junction resolvase
MNSKVFIGIDFGEARIGLAKSDPTGLIASPLKTITYGSISRAIEEIIQIVIETEAQGIVVGYPLAMDGGNLGERCRMVDDFIERLQKKYAGLIHKIDERYSSVEAEHIIHGHKKKIGKNKAMVDRIAAAIILQRFLDERK